MYHCHNYPTLTPRVLSPKHVGTAKVASKRWLTQTVYEDTRRDTNKTNANPKSKPIRPSQPLVHFARFVSYYSCCVCETFSRIRRELYWAQLRETFARFLTMILVGCCTRLRVGRGHPALTAKTTTAEGEQPSSTPSTTVAAIPCAVLQLHRLCPLEARLPSPLGRC